MKEETKVFYAIRLSPPDRMERRGNVFSFGQWYNGTLQTCNTTLYETFFYGDEIKLTNFYSSLEEAKKDFFSKNIITNDDSAIVKVTETFNSVKIEEVYKKGGN